MPEEFATSPQHTPSNIPYLVAVIAMSALGVGGVVGVLMLRPEGDNAALIAAIAGFIAPTTMALLAFMKTQDTHVLVDGRMDEFKRLLKANADAAEALAHKTGVTEGQAGVQASVAIPKPEPAPAKVPT